MIAAFVLTCLLGFQTRGANQPIPTINPAKEERTDLYWRRALQEEYRSAEELHAQDVRERRRGAALAKLSRGNPRSKTLALTFDDGPHPDFTPKLLDILKREGVPATFFVIGKQVEKYPDLLQQLKNAGMEIGNHTFSHVTLTKIPSVDILTEYRANNDLVKRLTGYQMRYCRPPGGDYDPLVIQAGLDCGLTTVLWTDDPGDYANPGTAILERRTLDKLSNGGIILLHDGSPQTLQTLPQIIDYAKRRGYRFVPLAELRER